jgi:UDP-N-acetyl-2-amino-2-deoxyglucuronate dehydrogenase
MSTGFGIVGTGMISHFHAKAIAEITGASVVACCDTIEERATSFADEYGCRAYTNIDDMLADADVHIVNVCTPSGAHRDLAVSAANAGKHVVVEKPLEITLARCDDIINACKENNVRLCAIFPSRFSSVNMELKKAVEEGRFGRLTLGDTYVKWWRTQDYYDSGGWRGTWGMDGGGAYMNQAIHQVDLLYWLMGDVVEVNGMMDTLAHERIEVEDVGVATLRFANGAIGVIEATTAAWPGLLKKTEIHGTKGTAIVEQDDVVRWEFEEETADDTKIREQFKTGSSNTGGAADPKAISHVGHRDQLQDFVTAIQQNGTPRVDGVDGRKSVEIILAIYQAAWSNQTVHLPLSGDPDRPSS